MAEKKSGKPARENWGEENQEKFGLRKQKPFLPLGLGLPDERKRTRAPAGEKASALVSQAKEKWEREKYFLSLVFLAPAFAMSFPRLDELIK